MIRVTQFSADPTQNVETVFAHVYLASLEMPIQDVALSVHLIRTVLVTKPVLVVNAETLARAHAHQTPFVRYSTIFRCVDAQTAWKETHLFTANLFRVWVISFIISP